MAFIVAAVEAIGTFFGASAATAGATGLAAIGTAVSVGVGVSAAAGAFGGAPKIPGLPAPPTIQSAAAAAQTQTQQLQAAQAYGGGTTDITLGGGTISSGNVQTKSLLGT